MGTVILNFNEVHKIETPCLGHMEQWTYHFLSAGFLLSAGTCGGGGYSSQVGVGVLIFIQAVKEGQLERKGDLLFSITFLPGIAAECHKYAFFSIVFLARFALSDFFLMNNYIFLSIC